MLPGGHSGIRVRKVLESTGPGGSPHAGKVLRSGQGQERGCGCAEVTVVVTARVRMLLSSGRRAGASSEPEEGVWALHSRPAAAIRHNRLARTQRTIHSSAHRRAPVDGDQPEPRSATAWFGQRYNVRFDKQGPQARISKPKEGELIPRPSLLSRGSEGVT
jgi:hypothetical protein